MALVLSASDTPHKLLLPALQEAALCRTAGAHACVCGDSSRCPAQVLHTGAEHAPGHTQALLQELLDGGSQGAPLPPAVAMQLAGAVQAGCAAFPLAGLPQGLSGACASPFPSVCPGGSCLGRSSCEGIVQPIPGIAGWACNGSLWRPNPLMLAPLLAVAPSVTGS